MFLDVSRFLQGLEQEDPKIFKKNQKFWKAFPKKLNDFLDDQAIDMLEESDPSKVDICPKCKTMVVPYDQYCSHCGTKFNWHS